MNTKNKWLPYRIENVVDATDAKMSVRNYIEQKDMRSYLSRISNKLSKAVEFGCGYGRMTQVLTEFASEVVGLEREAMFIRKASQLIPGISFIQVDDLSSVPLESEFADIITTFTFLQHLTESQVQEVIKEIIRCLKNEGHVLICEETDEKRIVGDINNPMDHGTLGRTVETYCKYFAPLTLEFTAPRQLEPGYRENAGTYMLLKK